MTIETTIQEAALLADSLADSPLFFTHRRAAEGIEAMQQAAAAFLSATSDAERIDAALWLGEAYLLLSTGLPDTGSTEHSTGWATAAQISKILGSPDAWEQRVREEFSNG